MTSTKVDINPLQSGGSIDPTKPIASTKKILMLIAGMAIFFVALMLGRGGANILFGFLGQLPGLSALAEASDSSGNGGNVPVVGDA